MPIEHIDLWDVAIIGLVSVVAICLGILADVLSRFFKWRRENR